MIISWFSKNKILLSCFLISIFGLLARFRAFWNKSFWNDEAYQLAKIKEVFRPFWNWNFYGDFTVFPGDYVLTYPFVQLFPTNEWGLRIPHVIATLLLFPAFYFLCRRHLKTWGGFVIAFLLLAFNATLINHSFEFRPYAVLPVLAVTVLFFIERLVVDLHQYSRWQRGWIALFLIFVAGFHAYGIFMIFLSFLLSLFVSLEKNSFQKIFERVGSYVGVVLVMCFLVWLWYAIGSKVTFKISADRFAGTDIHTFRFIPHPLQDLTGFLKGIVGNLTGNKYMYVLLLGLSGLFAVQNKETGFQWRMLMYLIIIPLFLMLILSMMGGYYFLQRQFIWVMPFWALLLAKQWDIFFIRLMSSSGIRHESSSRRNISHVS
jgi:4-amino-4-deoxy-L-arabinose transferase-like glycosyltransferase